MKDLRSPLAKARDDFFENEGKSLANAVTLRAPSSQDQYLRNRLERAFLAGAKAQEAINKATTTAPKL